MIHGSAKKYKYVFTKIDDRPQYLIMDTCNHCPFLINEMKTNTAKCSKFTNSNSLKDNLITTVYGYYQKMGKRKIFSDVNIPTWCQLPKDIIDISLTDNVFYIKNNKLITDVIYNFETNVNSNIIQTDDVEFSSIDGESLVSKPKSKQKTTESTTKKPLMLKPVLLSCSSCGGSKDNVNREKHNGMCDSCWEEYKKDNKHLYFSYINNFRLKRQESWKKDKYKIVDIKIK